MSDGTDIYVNQSDYTDGDTKPSDAFRGQLLLATNGKIWEWSGNEWLLVRESDGGGNASSLVIASGFGLKGIAHNRNIDAAATTHPGNGTNNVATWTEAENVREVTLVAVDDTGEAAVTDEAMLVAVNAPSDAVALTWLTDTGGVAQDVMYEMMRLGEPFVIQRTSAILQIDVLPLGDVTRVVLMAVGD